MSCTNSTNSSCLTTTKAPLSVGGIIGVAVGGFIFLVIVIILIICCCCCCLCKKATSRGDQRGTVRPHRDHEEPSVIDISNEQKVRPPYRPPPTNNPRPVVVQRPTGGGRTPGPPQPRPIQVINPPNYENQYGREPITVNPVSIYEPPPPARPTEEIVQTIDPPYYEPPPPPPTEQPYQAIDPPYYEVPVEPEPRKDTPPDVDWQPQEHNVVENVEGFRFD